MGLFGRVKKEAYINRLIRSFRIVYGCGDYAAIECLRQNYTSDELKAILDSLLDKAKDDSVYFLHMFDDNPFKETSDSVRMIDAKYFGK